MPIKFECPACGKRLNAPDGAAGKSANCPGCGKPVKVPSPGKVYDAEEVVDSPADDPAIEDWEAPDYDPAPPPEPELAPIERKPCPMCGEEISVSAKKCRFCGELLTKKKSGKKKGRRNDSDSEMETSDWLLCTLCSGIGCILAIVYLVQGKPKGGKMLAVSIAMIVFWNVLSFVFELVMQN